MWRQCNIEYIPYFLQETSWVTWAAHLLLNLFITFLLDPTCSITKVCVLYNIIIHSFIWPPWSNISLITAVNSNLLHQMCIYIACSVWCKPNFFFRVYITVIIAITVRNSSFFGSVSFCSIISFFLFESKFSVTVILSFYPHRIIMNRVMYPKNIC